jgi:hypothetical protein
MSKKLALACGVCFVFVAFAISGSLSAQTNPAPAGDSTTVPDKTVPVMDGGAGPCTADITVTDAAGAPVYAAKVNVHIAYGFMNVRKLDLEAGTDADGKLRFTGLPERIKHGIYFRASEGDRSGEAFDDPANTCQAHFTITLQKKP